MIRIKLQKKRLRKKLKDNLTVIESTFTKGAEAMIVVQNEKEEHKVACPEGVYTMKDKSLLVVHPEGIVSIVTNRKVNK